MAFDEPLNDPVPGREEAVQPRRSFWVIGLALFGLLVVLFAGAFLLDRQFRPRVGTEPVAGDQVPASKPNTPVAIIADAPTALSTASPTAMATSTVTPTATLSAIVPTATGLDRSALEREVREAYEKYWDVLIQAYLDLDTSRLHEVTADPELTMTVQQIEDLRERGRAAKLEVEHHILIVRLSPDEAIIYDEYVNNSVFLDATTKQVLPTKAPPEVEKISFRLKKFEDGWRVIDGLQQE